MLHKMAFMCYLYICILLLTLGIIFAKVKCCSRSVHMLLDPIFFFIVTYTNDAVYLSLSVPKKNVDIEELRICCLLLLFGFFEIGAYYFTKLAQVSQWSCLGS